MHASLEQTGPSQHFGMPWEDAHIWLGGSFQRKGYHEMCQQPVLVLLGILEMFTGDSARAGMAGACILCDSSCERGDHSSCDRRQGVSLQL